LEGLYFFTTNWLFDNLVKNKSRQPSSNIYRELLSSRQLSSRMTIQGYALSWVVPNQSE